MTLSLNCYVLGDDPYQMFTVKIEETKNVSILRDLIKEKKASTLKDVAASDLKLWKVDLPVSLASFQKNIGEINFKLVDNNSLSPLQGLSEVFLAPVSNHVHIVIKRPSVDKPVEVLNVGRPWSSQLPERPYRTGSNSRG
jgi:hypothetical protein